MIDEYTCCKKAKVLGDMEPVPIYMFSLLASFPPVSGPIAQMRAEYSILVSTQLV